MPEISRCLVEAWAELNQEDLMRNWERVQQGQSPCKLKGLA